MSHDLERYEKHKYSYIVRMSLHRLAPANVLKPTFSAIASMPSLFR